MLELSYSFSPQQMFIHFLIITKTILCIPYTSGSQLGVLLPSRGYLQHLETFLVVITRGDTTGI